MPYRRCRKSSAIFLCWALVLLFWQDTTYAAQGYVGGMTGASSGYATKVQGNGSEGSAAESDLANGLMVVTVEPKGTLWSIARRYATTVEELVSLNQIDNPRHIKAGQKLVVPAAQTSECTTIEPEKFATMGSGEITVEILVLEDSEPVSVGQAQDQAQDQVLDQAQDQARGTAPSLSRKERAFTATTDELELLARIIYAEARGENFEGQVAVGAVVLNRLEHPEFPKSIRGVIYEPGAFTAVADRQIRLQPDGKAYDAAKEALAGADPTNGAIYYYNPRTATDRWIKTRPVVKEIGNHVFGI